MSRASSLFVSQFWTGETGRKLRELNAEVRELAVYLFTNEIAQTEWFGIYRFDLDLAAKLTGRSMKGTIKNLAVLETLGFAKYDTGTEFVFVTEMAWIQSGAFLKGGLLAPDFKCQQARRWYMRVKANPFLGEWWDRYATAFHLMKAPDPAQRRDDGQRATSAEPPLIVQPGQPVPPNGDEPPQFALIPDARRTPRKPGDAAAMFEILAKRYPKPDKLDRARLKWLSMKPTQELFDAIMTALDWQTQRHDWIKENGIYVPALVNYLNDRRWLDRPPQLPRLSEQTAQAQQSVNEFVRGAKKP